MQPAIALSHIGPIDREKSGGTIGQGISMKISPSLQSEINYSRKLFEAGFDASDAGTSSSVLRREFARSARSSWLPVAIGAAVGLLAVHFARKSKSGTGSVVGALVGGAIGFGGAVAWNSRDVTSEMLRKAGRNISAVRDERWLEKHPIDYA